MVRNYIPRVEKEELFRLYVHEQRSMREIGEILHASPTTVHGWMKKYDIPRRPSWTEIKIKTIDGVDHRTCNGPSHDQPVWLPLKNFGQKANGQPRSTCRACDSYQKNSEPLVDFTVQYAGWFEHVVNRLGVMEAARRLNISQSGLRNIRRNNPLKIKRRTARRIVQLVHELNGSQEVRHRDSIRHGSYLRGREEKTPTIKEHYYKRDGDVEKISDRERKRQQRSS